jgi:hypothetical protein
MWTVTMAEFNIVFLFGQTSYRHHTFLSDVAVCRKSIDKSRLHAFLTRQFIEHRP